MRPSYTAALIGAGIARSLTPPMHEREGARKGLNYAYRTVDITALGVPPEAVGGWSAPRWRSGSMGSTSRIPASNW